MRSGPPGGPTEGIYDRVSRLVLVVDACVIATSVVGIIIVASTPLSAGESDSERVFVTAGSHSTTILLVFFLR